MRAGLLLVLAAGIAYAAGQWDRRSPAMLDIEAAQGRSPFGVRLEPDAQVLWVKEPHFEEALATWIALERPSYYSVTQKAGLLFNRPTAVEAMAREAITRPLEKQDDACATTATDGVPTPACLSGYRRAIAEVCAGAGGKLGYVVTKYDLGPLALGRWPISFERRGDRLINNYLYRCSDFPAGRAS